ncbi:Uncharacterized membrane protein YbhN, UPF0104 family [Polynucleobacter meluiroseus]|uniref:Uncharacterized membrane protein YbhN, UPF0104 family n=1 Tax=Polynucleobacter meluiroseus TaxID=1938814 RepID=A0A240E2J2_9BURK|nr:lysylphosphatidylglycerol synthase transmembrane domain-containing protein [Polynucleobacter meluiroseus]SNX29432.1 Uncharacterized membrane protein YbhN, UPF0104 family [Polynucleobacter meluiroseus]
MLKKIWPSIRIVLSLLLLWKATSGIDWNSLLHSEIQLQPIWFLLALACMTLAFLLGGFRWGKFMEAVGFPRRTFSYIGLYFAGGLVNQGLPSTIGGDSYRAITATHLTQGGELAQEKKLDAQLHQAVDIDHAPPRLRLSFAMAFIDRFIGVVGNNLLGGIGLVIGGATLAIWGQDLGYLVIGATALGLIVLALGLVWTPTRQLLNQFLQRFQMMNAMPGLQLAFAWPMNTAQAAFAVSIHFLTILTLFCCLKAYGVNAPIEALMIGLPALSLLLMLPISISGWGLREATLSSVLALWGVNPSITVLASISYGAITVIAVLPGAYFLLKRK